MKKLIAFLISAVIPVFIPMCAIVTLPVCVAEKYLPQDLQKSVQYGVQFLKLVWNLNEEKPQQTTAVQELTPVVETKVTSMMIATSVANSDCEFEEGQEFARPRMEPVIADISTFIGRPLQHKPVSVAIMAEEIDALVKTTIQHKQTLRQMRNLPEWQTKLYQEKFEMALKRAIRNVEIKAQQAKRNRKSCPSPVKISIKSKSPISA